MIAVKVLSLTLIFYLILNYSKLRRGIFSGRDLMLPFALGFSISIVDSFMRAAIGASILVFVVLSAVCFGVLYFYNAAKR
jgi:hypothetical protein